MNLHPLVGALLPEITLVVAAVLILLAGLAAPPALRDRTPFLALVGLLGYLWLTFTPDMAEIVLPSVRIDLLTRYTRAVTGIVGLLIVLVNRHVPSRETRGEFFALLLLSLAGISLVAASDDLLLLFFAIELVSVPTYVLIALSRTNDAMQEATCKYFFLGSFAAAITLYGFSFLYGAAGTTSMPEIARMALAPTPHVMLTLGLMLGLVSLAFKVAAVPFHFYVPDVYQGAAASLSGALGFMPKFAGFLGLIRILDMIGWRLDGPMFWMLWVIAAVTMTVGNTLALGQTNVKRVLAYSSIAHTGYMLIALLAGPGGDMIGRETPLRDGIAALLFYMAIYGVMNLGAFSALAYFRSRATGEPVETFEELSDAARSRPWAALALAVCAIGLMGLPPTAGLLGKLYLFSSALAVPVGAPHREAMIWLVVIGVINAAIAAAYYLRIVAACALGTRREDTPSPTACDALRVGLFASAAIVIAAFIWPSPLAYQARMAAHSVERVIIRNARSADDTLRMQDPVGAPRRATTR